MRLFLPLLILLVGLSAALPAQERRVALLIGNSEYEVPRLRLRNPAQDVALLGEGLRSLDFKVDVLTDADAGLMASALTRFAFDASGADIALIYFAGHAVQVEGENYLIGTRFTGRSFRGLLRESVTATHLGDMLGSTDAGLGLILLDACRDNPLDFTGAGGDGLAVPEGGAGLLYAYATDPGNVASDGAGDNSPFASALVKHLVTPGLEIRILFGRVRQEVMLETNGAQVPWVEEAVLGEHYLAGRATPLGETEGEIAAWREISDAPTIDELQGYLATYPDGMFAEYARSWIDLRSIPAAAQPAVLEPDRLLAEAEADRVAAALGVLGFVQTSRGTTDQVADLKAGLASFATARPELKLDSLDPVYAEAARVSTFLAASVSQRIRTDLVALEAIERIHKITTSDLALMQQLATDSPEDQAILRTAEAAVADVALRRERILARLDESREYYGWLVSAAAEGFSEYVDGNTVGPGGARSLDVLPQIAEDGVVFSRNVVAARSLPPGSLAWMREFLPAGE